MLTLLSKQEDTFALWKMVCSSKLLVQVSLVLLLNKRDILQRKLESGIRFGRYVKSYTGKNKWDAVAKCELLASCAAVTAGSLTCSKHHFDF